MAHSSDLIVAPSQSLVSMHDGQLRRRRVESGPSLASPALRSNDTAAMFVNCSGVTVEGGNFYRSEGHITIVNHYGQHQQYTPIAVPSEKEGSSSTAGSSSLTGSAPKLLLPPNNSDTDMDVLKSLPQYLPTELMPDSHAHAPSAAAGSTLHLGVMRVVLKRRKGKGERLLVRRYASSTTQEEFVEEVKLMSKLFDPYIMHLVGVSAKSSPTKFTVYSDPSPITYNNYKSTLQGSQYREFDAQYEITFGLALSYLKEHVSGLALEQIFTETRCVKESGDAFILVPSPHLSKSSELEVACKIIKSTHAMIKRRVAAAPNVVRCPVCLPDVFSWYGGLSRAANRIVRNLESSGIHLESLKAADLGWDQQECNTVVSALRNADSLMVNLATDVLQRSRECQGGRCGWCGGYWTMEEKSKITEVPLDDRPGPDSLPNETSDVDLRPKEHPTTYAGLMPVSHRALVAAAGILTFGLFICGKRLYDRYYSP